MGNKTTIIISILLALLLFAIDIVIPLGVAAGVPYVLVIFISANYKEGKLIIPMAIATTILTIVGLYISPTGGELWKTLTNRFLAIFVIWITAMLLRRIKIHEREKINSLEHAVQKDHATLNEKQTLLKEIHHRVKNNLQIISSLLSLQSRDVQDEKTLNFYRESKNRINSMAMVHEMLYETENLRDIDCKIYIRKLVGGLMTSLDHSDDIKTQIETPEIKMNIDSSISLGLLINEIVTNSIKYAFEDKEEHEIYIYIETISKAHNTYQLFIGDNGIGYEESFTENRSNSLGLGLIKSLTAQLDGEIRKDKSKEGTHYILSLTLK